MQLGSRPVDTTSLLSTLRRSRLILKDTEMMPGKPGRRKGGLSSLLSRTREGEGWYLGQGLTPSPVEGARSPRSSGRWTLNDDGEEGGIPRYPVLSGTQLHHLLALLLGVTTSRSVSGPGFSLLLLTTVSQISLDGIETPFELLFAPTLGSCCIRDAPALQDFLVKRKKPWMHPQRAGAGLHTIVVLGTAPGLIRIARCERPRVGGWGETKTKKTAPRRAISIPFNPCLCWARLSSGSGSDVSCQRGRMDGDQSERRLSGARGSHTWSLLSGRIYPENSPKKL